MPLWNVSVEFRNYPCSSDDEISKSEELAVGDDAYSDDYEQVSNQNKQNYLQVMHKSIF